MTEAEARRAQFEALSDGTRNKKIAIAVNTASAAYAGFTLGGPVGAAVGAGLGLLIGWWKYKSYREQVYDQYEAAGLVSRPRRRIRSILYQDPSDPGFYRYPHGELVGDVVLEVMAENYPNMTEAGINEVAYDMVKTFHQFRRDNPDTPLEVAADVILFMNGIIRNPDTGIYGRFDLDALLEAATPPEQPVEPETPARKLAGQIDSKTVVWLLAAVVVLAVVVERSK